MVVAVLADVGNNTIVKQDKVKPPPDEHNSCQIMMDCFPPKVIITASLM